MPTKEELYEKAVDLFSENKLEESIATYKEVLALDPKYVDALLGLAMAHAQGGRLDEAIAVAKQAIEADPESVLPHTTLSMFYQQKGMIPEAEKESAVARTLSWKEELREKARQKEQQQEEP
ncbi:MAG: tetratricopeptide repeat protein [Deltaproteobacteria bacterium]|nr:tetratricopeptide repeat protein [Deltaproteobacteria bacterium]